MGNKKQKLLRDLSVGFIAFMCTILLTSLTLIFIVEQTLFSPAYLNRTAVKTNYYDNLAKQINVQIQDFGLGSAIPSKILENSVQPQLVKADFEAYTFQAFNGSDLTIDDADFLATVKAPILAYAAENKQELTAETKDGINRFADLSFEAYSDFIKLPFLPALGQKIQLFANKLTLFKVIIGSCLALLLILTIYILQWWHRFIRYLSFIFSGSGLMLIGAPLAILLSKVIDRISIASKPLYLLLTTYLKDFIATFIYVGIAFLVLGLLSGLLSQVMRKKA